MGSACVRALGAVAPGRAEEETPGPIAKKQNGRLNIVHVGETPPDLGGLAVGVFQLIPIWEHLP